jgi:hypothetical protein
VDSSRRAGGGMGKALTRRATVRQHLMTQHRVSISLL